MPTTQEKLLIKNLKNGDAASFERLFDYYYPKLVNFANKFLHDTSESENITQEVFILVWEKRNDLNLELSFSSFLFKISKNRIINVLRKKVNEQKYMEYLVHSGEDKLNTVLQQMNYNELMNEIHKVINQLPERRRKIFNLSRQDGLSYKQIAKKLEISENTVDTQIRNVLDELRSRLKQIYPLITTVLFYLLS